MIKLTEILTILDQERVQYQFAGQKNCIIDEVKGWSDYQGNGITFYSGKDLDQLKKWENNKEGLIVTSINHLDNLDSGQFLFVDSPKVIFMLIGNLLLPTGNRGIHNTAIIDSDAIIGENVSIGAYCVIGKVRVGNNSEIGSHVTINDKTEIGNNVKILNGCSIGEPGLGSEVGENNMQITFPHFGGVVIGDNVVIGTNSVVNCGALTDTIIGENSHISSNCLVAHNCKLGKSVYLAATASLAGSVNIGDRAYLGFGVNVKEGVKLAEEITVGINVTVQKNYSNPGITLMNTSFPKEIGSIFTLKRTFKK